MSVVHNTVNWTTHPGITWAILLRPFHSVVDVIFGNRYCPRHSQAQRS